MDHLPATPTVANAGQQAESLTEVLAEAPAGVRSAAPVIGADAEVKPDPLSLMAVDANALAQAIWSGQGQDVSRLIADLLKDRHAA